MEFINCEISIFSQRSLMYLVTWWWLSLENYIWSYKLLKSLVENIAFQVLEVEFLSKEHKTFLNKVEFFTFLKFYVCCILDLRKYFFYFWEIIREIFISTGLTPSTTNMASAFQEETLKHSVKVKCGKFCFFWSVLYAELDKCLGIFTGASCVEMSEISTDWNS